MENETKIQLNEEKLPKEIQDAIRRWQRTREELINAVKQYAKELLGIDIDENKIDITFYYIGMSIGVTNIEAKFRTTIEHYPIPETNSRIEIAVSRSVVREANTYIDIAQDKDAVLPLMLVWRKPLYVAKISDELYEAMLLTVKIEIEKPEEDDP